MLNLSYQSPARPHEVCLTWGVLERDTSSFTIAGDFGEGGSVAGGGERAR